MMKNRPIDTLIVSDIHLGSEVSRAKDLIDFLDTASFSRLILLGDVFDRKHHRSFPEIQTKLLDLLVSLAKTKEVVWVQGNHDWEMEEYANYLQNIPIYQEYEWEFGGKRHLAIHGHQFDDVIKKFPIFSGVMAMGYLLMQKLDTKDAEISRFIKKKSKTWMRLAKKVGRGALLYAKKKEVDYVYCGHTHLGGEDEEGGIKYLNTGCWTDFPAMYVAVGEDGPRAHEWDGRDSGKN